MLASVSNTAPVIPIAYSFSIKSVPMYSFLMIGIIRVFSFSVLIRSKSSAVKGLLCCRYSATIHTV